MKNRKQQDYFIGLDIGTNSVGYAVTDLQYHILKFNGKSMWGSRLFDEAETAETRRMFRTARRRLNRRRQRLDWLQEIFHPEIEKVDPGFFQRLQESPLFVEDRTEKQSNALFNDPDFDDKSYHTLYPTIYHLRKALMTEDKKYDIRLVYLALHHIIKHRGHFLFNTDLGDVTSFEFSFANLKEILKTELNLEIKHIDEKAFSEILKDAQMTKNDKKKKAMALFSGTVDKDSKKQLQAVINLACGAKANPVDLFADNTLKDTELENFSLLDKPYEELRDELEGVLADRCVVIDAIKAVHDWSILADMLDGGESGDKKVYISTAKVAIYEKHKKDLHELKEILKRYCKEEYKPFFMQEGKDNYCAYIGDRIETKKKLRVTKCSQEDFYNRVRKLLEKAVENGYPQKEADLIMAETRAEKYMPLQVSKDNGVIPHQIHLSELEIILKKASKYYRFLTEKDENGISNSEKIILTFKYKIPYYVGPLNSQGSKNAWMIRNAGMDGRKITPWNFNEIVNHDASEELFIERMKNPCTYVLGASVLPKNSLLYSEYAVLNELNNVRICGEKLPVDLKMKILDEVFKNTKKVTGNKLFSYLKAQGFVPKRQGILDSAKGSSVIEKSDITGIDGDFNSGLTSYYDLYDIFGDDLKKDSVRKMCERIIFLLTIHHDDKNLMEKRIRKEYSEKELSKVQMKKVCRLSYQGWGRLSRDFLEDIQGANKETGEYFNIINALRNTEDNLMQLLSAKYSFAEALDERNKSNRKEIRAFTYENVMQDVITSPAVKRASWQALLIVREICKIMGHPPKKVFIEVTRGNTGNQGRTTSRKDQLTALYANIKDEERNWKEELKKTPESEFRRRDLYLYYTQMGRCMYSGEKISLADLADKNIYDTDHIYPKSLTKDDSWDNLVLVKKTINAKKDRNVMDSAIQEKMSGFWSMLKNKRLISAQKHERLMRRTPLTVEERASFINRQIVETAQSSKIVADLFQQLYPETKVVYVKARTVSDFRKDPLDVVKVRSLNDLHHAKDAYLNIVVGNVYHEKFTSNPLRWLKENQNTEYSLNAMFSHDIVRRGKGGKVKYVAWRKGKNGSMAVVRKTMVKNDIICTRQERESKSGQNGGFFDQNIVSRKDNAAVSIKKGMDVLKYGGYKSITTKNFALVEAEDKNGELQRYIVGVPLLLASEIKKNEVILLDYCRSEFGLENPEIIKTGIKKNALLKIKGFPMRLTGRSQKSLLFQGDAQLIVPEEMERYLKKVEKYIERNKKRSNKKELLQLTMHDEITTNNNIELYKLLVDKLENSIYAKRTSNQYETLKSGMEKFTNLCVEEQCLVLNEILNLFRCNPLTADLRLIGGKGQVGKLTHNMELNKGEESLLVHQSVTGLFETKVDLLTCKKRP